MRPIDADALIASAKAILCDGCTEMFGCGDCSVDDLLMQIKNAPTIDAVPVVRCKECRYGHIDHCLGETCWICGLSGRVSVGDEFCSRGVKRDAETD